MILAVGVGGVIVRSWDVAEGLIAGVATTTTLLVVGRLVYERASSRALEALGVRRRVVIVGQDGTLIARVRTAMGTSRAGILYEYLGSVTVSSQQVVAARRVLDATPVLGSLSSLPSLIPDLKPNEIIVASPDIDPRRLNELRGLLAYRRVRLLIPSRGYTYEPRETLELEEIAPRVLSGRDWALKRALDWAVIVLVAVAAAPLWLGAVALVALFFGRPVLVRDRRIGYLAQPFDMYWLRVGGRAGGGAEAPFAG